MFALVKYQLIMGFNGPVAISQSAIHEAMTLYEIKDRQQCFEKLLTLGAWWIDRLRDNENH